jgi:hypothetical protein
VGTVTICELAIFMGTIWGHVCRESGVSHAEIRLGLCTFIAELPTPKLLNALEL